ncbi:peptide chain release factor aRF-1 [Halomarina oriensis]|uniref:Peptide chain release factor 1 n=1 Tax=Halomarina oriensis TaxID=671145 RepID=A0A6B0GHZ9_9EURY|nr:peptide chain release factor aRF-1 [Halomarina oriensis]MWG34240.1 peptide chain release factor 1 [Halomarina oriensis]
MSDTDDSHASTDETTSSDRTTDRNLTDRIAHLDSLHGEGTELVTVSVPPGKSLRTVRARIADEYASAEHIRSKRTRERVQRALDRVQRTLRAYDGTPENGLVAYAGVVDGDLHSFVFDDLPRPVAESTYRCADRFDVGPLETVVAPEATFGLVVVERGGAAVGRLVGERVVPVWTGDSRVMGKTRAGGQSAQRFARERERQTQEFFERVARVAADAFLGEAPVAGLVVGGTLTTADRFVADGHLDHRLRERLLGTYPVEYATEQGLDRLVEQASEQLLDAEQRAARDRLDRFYAGLRDDGAVTYGEGDVERATEFGAVDTLLVASTVARETRERLDSAVEERGGETVLVAADTERGAGFADTFGVGALLRFPVD